MADPDAFFVPPDEPVGYGPPAPAQRSRVGLTVCQADGAKARADGAKARADGAKARADGAKARADGAKARANGAKGSSARGLIFPAAAQGSGAA